MEKDVVMRLCLKTMEGNLMSKEKPDIVCDMCLKEVKQVTQRECFVHGYAVEWVCDDCIDLDSRRILWKVKIKEDYDESEAEERD